MKARSCMLIMTATALLLAAPAAAIDGEVPPSKGPAKALPHSAVEVPAPAEPPASAESPAQRDVPGLDWSVLNPLGGHYSARYRSENLPIHSGAGARVGRGEVSYSIPVTGPLYLRSGVLIDYVEDAGSPVGGQERRELQGTPTVGFEIRF